MQVKKANNLLLRASLLTIFLSLMVSFNSIQASTSENEEQAKQEEGFSPGDMIMHHIKDGYKWHFFTIGDFHATIYLPMILYTPGEGLDVFISKNLYKSEEHTYKGYNLHHGELTRKDEKGFYDFSITKNVFSMMISAVFLLLLFLSIARRYKQNPNSVPRGSQSVLEPVIVFVRDEITKPAIGDNWMKYFPYIITVFFFVWLNNMLGLIPGAANVTGNIAVTLALSLITFIVTNVSATKDYWKHIFNTPGVPIWLKLPIPIMPLVEFIGIFTKPVALTIRLFANMTAGHIIILSIISLIFIFGEMSAGVGYIISPFSMAFTIFLYLLKLLVAAIQAYIFAMLSAVFIGQAIEEHHE